MQATPTTQPPQIPDLPEGPSLDNMRGPVEIPLFEPWQIAVIAAFVILILGLLIWTIVAWTRAAKNRRTPVPPHEAALAELDTAAALSADAEQFTVLSSRALRRYFEEGLQIPALGRTTEEFLHSLENHAQLDAEARATLARCMERFDRVKFGRHSLETAERETLTAEAKSLIQQTRAQNREVRS